MGSAGKFITHIAALQCVERGLISLDEPVCKHLPELKDLHILSRNNDGGIATEPFRLTSPSTKITLRHLLSHSSGITHESDPLVQAWRESNNEGSKEDYHPKADPASNPSYSTPLLYEPGEGWNYGASIEWTSVLVARLTKQPLGKYIHEHIFTPLSMTSSAYNPDDFPDIMSKLLQMVRREDNKLLPVKHQRQRLICSIPDLTRLLSDFISPSSKILSQVSINLLFTPQFPSSSPALHALRNDTENYAAPAGIPANMKEPAVNHSLAALVIEDEMPLSHMPAGAVTWNGMPNVIWTMHREKEIAMVFATQLLPVDDERTVGLAMEFFRGAWGVFC
jgi:CubicO group peptidase (beta-lactamase class C family)